MDGNICDQFISILINPRSKYSYVNPDLVNKCGLGKELYENYLLVPLALGTKERVHHWVTDFAFKLNCMCYRYIWAHHSRHSYLYN